MEIYAPLAERLGIWQIKWELEDLAFKVLEPERFRELAKLLDTRRKGREALHRAGDRRARAAARGRPASRPTSRAGPKHIYSIYKKMQRKSAEFGEIYDVYAIRILVDEVARLLRGARHRPLALAPDPRPVRRLHRRPQEQPLPVAPHGGHRARRQAARDPDPDPRRCTRSPRSASPPTGATRKAPSPTASTTPSSPGCASSWTGSATSRTRPSSSRASSSTSSRTRSSCSRPKGDIKDLPAGATPLDFAYRIHTDVGHRTIGAKVNNRLVPLDYRLKNGDIVEIVTTKGEHGPSRDWLNVVRTSHAREKIRQWFKRQERDENIVHGRESLERELRRLARTLDRGRRAGPDRRGRAAATTTTRSTTSTPPSATARSAPSRWSCGSASSTTPRAPLPTVAPAAARAADRRRPGQGRRRPARPLRASAATRSRATRSSGFITRGKGVTVHLRTCPTVVNEREVSRLIEVEWEAAPTQTYPIAIRVEAYDRTGLLSDITQVVAENKVNILAADVGGQPGPHRRS